MPSELRKLAAEAARKLADEANDGDVEALQDLQDYTAQAIFEDLQGSTRKEIKKLEADLKAAGYLED